MRIHRLNRGITEVVVALGLALAAAASPGARLSIDPIIVNLDSAHAIGALRLRNRGDTAVVMQADIRAWDVAGGRDRYRKTDALIVMPPIFEIAPHGGQVVRVGLRRPAASATEKAFRVFLREAPALSTKARPQGVQVRLTLAIPVFVAPQSAPQSRIVWRARRIGHGKLRISARNEGNVHIKTHRLALDNKAGEVLARAKALVYLLPGSTRFWTLTTPPGAKPPYRIRAWAEDRVLAAEITPDNR